MLPLRQSRVDFLERGVQRYELSWRVAEERSRRRAHELIELLYDYR